jgi:hypothetical protein
MKDKNLKFNIRLEIPTGLKANKTLNKFIAAAGLSLTTILSDRTDFGGWLLLGLVAVVALVLALLEKRLGRRK